MLKIGFRAVCPLFSMQHIQMEKTSLRAAESVFYVLKWATLFYSINCVVYTILGRSFGPIFDTNLSDPFRCDGNHNPIPVFTILAPFFVCMACC